MLKRWLKKWFDKMLREHDSEVRGLHARVDGLTVRVEELEKDLANAKQAVKEQKKADETARLRKWLQGEPTQSSEVK